MDDEHGEGRLDDFPWGHAVGNIAKMMRGLDGSPLGCLAVGIPLESCPGGIHHDTPAALEDGPRFAVGVLGLPVVHQSRVRV